MIRIKPATVLGGVASKATGFLGSFTWKAWLIALGIAVAFAGVQTTRLAWAKADIADMKAEREREIREAVERAREADQYIDGQRQTDTERNIDADRDRRDAARDGGRDAVNCERLRRAYPDSAFPACD